MAQLMPTGGGFDCIINYYFGDLTQIGESSENLPRAISEKWGRVVRLFLGNFRASPMVETMTLLS